MNKYKGFFALLTSGVVYGSFGVWIRLLSKELTTYQQIGLRNTIGLLFALIIIILFKQKWSFGKVNKPTIFLYATIFPVAAIFFVFAMVNTKIATAIFAFYAASYLSSLVIGRCFFKDKSSLSKILGFILALTGIIVMNFPLNVTTINAGFIFGLIGGALDSVSNGFRRLLSGRIDRFVLVAIQMLGGVVVAGVLILLTKQSLLVQLSVPTIFVALVFGFLLMLVVFLTLVGFQNFDVNLGTIIISSELFFAPLFAAIAFKEIPNTKELIGGAIIIASIFVSNLQIFKTGKKVLAT